MTRVSPAPTSPEPDGDWRHRAACRAAPNDLWFPPEWEREPERTWRINDAKAVCASCPVTTTCLRDALDNDQQHGVWGGLSEDERRAMKRRHARTRRTDDTSPPIRKAPDAPGKTDPTARPACGTYTGYEAHTRKHERQCDTCRAWKAANRAATAGPDCGTLPGYRSHQDRRETACDPCKAAKATDSTQYRRNRNAA